MVATTTYIFECEESTYNSRVQKCFFYEDDGIIREYDHGSTEAYNMDVATNNRGNIFNFFVVSENILSLEVLYFWQRYQPGKILLQPP
jgi:hypothetical protein